MPAFTPQFFYANVLGAGATVTFPEMAGQVIIKNSSAAGDLIWVAIGGVIPAAGFANGVKRLTSGESLNLNNVSLRQVSGIDGGGLTGDMEVVVIPNAGGGSGVL